MIYRRFFLTYRQFLLIYRRKFALYQRKFYFIGTTESPRIFGGLIHIFTKGSIDFFEEC